MPYSRCVFSTVAMICNNRGFHRAVARNPLPQRAKRVGRGGLALRSWTEQLVSPGSSSYVVRSGLQTAQQWVPNQHFGAGKVWFLAPDGPPSTGPEGRTDDATAPSKLDLPRSRRGHVQLNCHCRPTASAQKSVRDHNSRPKPRKPRPQNAEGVQGGVVD
jgi:hypothetical protein